MNHRSISAIAALTVIAFAPAAWAINKCKTPDGKVVYQDKPCEGAEKINLSNEGSYNPESEKYWAKQVAQREHKTRVEIAINNRRILVGMTADEARRSWGNPTKINSTIGSYGKHEQWVYSRGRAQAQYIYVENGVVTSMQSPE